MSRLPYALRARRCPWHHDVAHARQEDAQLQRVHGLGLERANPAHALARIALRQGVTGHANVSIQRETRRFDGMGSHGGYGRGHRRSVSSHLSVVRVSSLTRNDRERELLHISRARSVRLRWLASHLRSAASLIVGSATPSAALRQNGCAPRFGGRDANAAVQDSCIGFHSARRRGDAPLPVRKRAGHTQNRWMYCTFSFMPAESFSLTNLK